MDQGTNRGAVVGLGHDEEGTGEEEEQGRDGGDEGENGPVEMSTQGDGVDETNTGGEAATK